MRTELQRRRAEAIAARALRSAGINISEAAPEIRRLSLAYHRESTKRERSTSRILAVQRFIG